MAAPMKLLAWLAVVPFLFLHGLLPLKDGVPDCLRALRWPAAATEAPIPAPSPVPAPGLAEFPLLQTGSYGLPVQVLQGLLRAMGYSDSAPNGLFDEATLGAVLWFQQLNGLPATGIVDADGWIVLLSEGAVPAYLQSALTPVPTAVPERTPSPGEFPPLQFGSSGRAVEALQRSLVSLGYFPSAVDGIFGERTQDAVLWFQHFNGLPATGIVDADNWIVLLSGAAVPAFPQFTSSPAPTAKPEQTPGQEEFPLLQLGSAGAAVETLQKRLAALGYFASPVDGRFGEKTLEAVRWFQQVTGLSADGIVGSRTWEALLSDDALPAPPFMTPLPRPTPQRTPLPRPTPVRTPPPRPTPHAKYKTLSPGSEGAEVTRLQDRLRELGYFSANEDGIFGDDTRDAVTMFQKYNALAADGIAGVETQTLLFEGVNVRPAWRMGR